MSGRLSEGQSFLFNALLEAHHVLRHAAGEELAAILEEYFPNPERRPSPEQFIEMRNRYQRHLN